MGDFSVQDDRKIIAALLGLIISFSAQAGSLTIAAASDLKFAMSDIRQLFLQQFPGNRLNMVYGSSGKFAQQIENGAPYDLYFSASIEYPQRLVKKGLAATEPKLYAMGKIVLWSREVDASKVSLKALATPQFRRIAIANPKHAPYGLRAKQALQAVGVWQAVKPKLVMGENIAQTAQMIEMGGAKIGIIALSLALSPQLSRQGHYGLIPQNLYQPLKQAYIVTQHGKYNPLAFQFAQFMQTEKVKRVMKKYGFEVQ
ncbi:molybdate ABC transporter substrate-binding protein [Galenea microaerophila]